MHELFAGLSDWVQTHGLAGVFLFMLVENVGVPFPTELGFIAAQLFVSHGHVPYWEAYSVITAGHVCGAAVSYYAGRAGDSAIARWVVRSPHMAYTRQRMQRWFARYGPLAILLGRLVGQVRPWASLLAGMAQVPAAVFWPWTVIGSLVYTGLVMSFTSWGYALWLAHPSLRTAGVIVLVLVILGFPLYAGVHGLVLRRRQQAVRPEAVQRAAGTARDADGDR